MTAAFPGIRPLALLLAVLLVPMPGAQAAEEAPVRVLVTLEDVALPFALPPSATLVEQDAEAGLLVVETTDPAALEASARGDANVRYVERDEQVTAAAAWVPNDPRYRRDQWNLQASTTGIAGAWATTRGSTAVRVCVLDSGIDRGHEDLRRVPLAGWKDFVNRRAHPYDDKGHGTHVAGIIAASADNRRGIAGIADVELLMGKVLNGFGGGRMSDVARGLHWCVDQGAHIVTMSLGGLPTATLKDAVDRAVRKGVLLVAAVGNSGPCRDCVRYPAAYEPVIAVGCTDRENRQCRYSNEGPELDLVAPGDRILAPWPKGKQPCPLLSSRPCYAPDSGTSMSAPHVAGLAALVKSAHPEATAGQIEARLRATARDLGPPGRDDEYGWGLIQGAAVTAASPDTWA